MTSSDIYNAKKRISFSFHAILLSVSLVTLMPHFMTSVVSSDTTRSTHLRLGSLSLRICFLTIASNARSGVKSPVLKGHGVRLYLREGVEGWRQILRAEEKEDSQERKEKRKRNVFLQLVGCCQQIIQATKKDKPQDFTSSS